MADAGRTFLRTARHPADGGPRGLRPARSPLRVGGHLRGGLRGDRRGARGRGERPWLPHRSSTPFRARRWWPSAPSSCCASTPGWTSPSCPGSPSSTWPGSDSAIDPVRAGVRLVDAEQFGAQSAVDGGPVPGGAVLVADVALRHKAVPGPRGGRRRPRGGAPAPPRAPGRAGGGGRMVGPGPHGQARPPHLPLRPRAPRAERRRAARWPGWKSSCARCANAARGIAPRRTAR